MDVGMGFSDGQVTEQAAASWLEIRRNATSGKVVLNNLPSEGTCDTDAVGHGGEGGGQEVEIGIEGAKPSGLDRPSSCPSVQSALNNRQIRRNVFKFLSTLIVASAHEIEDADELERLRHVDGEAYFKACETAEEWKARALRSERKVAEKEMALCERDDRLTTMQVESGHWKQRCEKAVSVLQQAVHEKDRHLTMMRNARNYWKRRFEVYEELFRGAAESMGG